MNRLSVILCETMPRWAPALRVAIARASPQWDVRITIHEVRGLADLRRAVEQWPNSLLGIEIERSSVGQVLTKIPSILALHSQSRAVAFLNRTPEPLGHDSENQLIIALHEAGFLEVALSPRRLDCVVENCRRFAEREASAGASEKHSYCEQVQRGLPWQPAMLPVG